MDEIIVRKVGFDCIHNKYIVDAETAHVECGICKEKLNPMWVLGQLCNIESRFNMKIKHLNKLVEMAGKKNRCKCEHCGKMTKIQQRIR